MDDPEGLRFFCHFYGELPADLRGECKTRIEVENNFGQDEDEEHADLHHIVVVEFLHPPEVHELVCEEEAREKDVREHNFLQDVLA